MSTKRKLPQKLGQPMVKQSAKVLAKGNLDESKAVVSGGGNATKSNTNGIKEVIEISSESSSDEEEDSDEENAEEVKSAAGDDVAMEDATDTPQEENDENIEPSFGDLVRANGNELIDVAGAFEDRVEKYFEGAQIQAPSGASLGTVLTQALKTSDVALLESCFHTTDHPNIRATIQRLESPLAGTLLHKLAERLHRKPGRAGSLMVWVQWTLVTHGGYLATQPALMKKLTELNRVIDERAKGLQSLLALKGKLDMLEAQMELRRNMQNQGQRMDEDDEEGVIYVEDQESEEEGVAKAQNSARNGDNSDMESEASEDMPMRNGLIAESEDEEGESSEEDDLIDDEAEDTDADTGDEDEVDHDDQDSLGEEDETDDGAAPPLKMPRTGPSSKRR